MKSVPFEIERKYLIKKPDEKFLSSVCTKKIRISQSYLTAEHRGLTQRIRRIDDGNSVSYVMTEKKDITAVRRIELERPLDAAEYRSLLKHRRAAGTNTIEKTRFVIPNGKFNFEVDLFDGWESLALMEIELESENETFEFCDYMKFFKFADENTEIVILKEVTGDRKFRNYSMSLAFPEENDEVLKLETKYGKKL